jgi:ATP-dependent Lon protease
MRIRIRNTEKLLNSHFFCQVVQTAARELKRLRKMSAQMPEYPMLRHYLELIAELPWSTSSQAGFVYPELARIRNFF